MEHASSGAGRGRIATPGASSRRALCRSGRAVAGRRSKGPSSRAPAVRRQASGRRGRADRIGRNARTPPALARDERSALAEIGAQPPNRQGPRCCRRYGGRRAPTRPKERRCLRSLPPHLTRLTACSRPRPFPTAGAAVLAPAGDRAGPGDLDLGRRGPRTPRRPGRDAGWPGGLPGAGDRRRARRPGARRRRRRARRTQPRPPG
jgi:hypothetical protein